jgi:hypothetical protein
MDQLNFFIEKANTQHNNKYDYSLVKYINSDTKVIIKCSIHGEFERVPYNHIKKKLGCPYCIKEEKKKLQQEELNNIFISKAKEKHINKYDYSNIHYVNSKTPIQIKCNIEKHGVFKQIPSSHLSGSGCPLCANIKNAESKKKTLEWFIQKANEKHNNKYDYSNSVYISSQDFITIECKVKNHNPFTQKANNHLQGNGCPICAIEESSIRQKLTKEEFILKAIETHGSELYNYCFVNYINYHTKVLIHCNFHNTLFEQAPSQHIAGNGCTECAIQKRKEKQTFTLEQFIEKANIVHNNKYKYDSVCYVNSQTPIQILCKDHGIFSQIPNSHLQGYGCVKCAIQKNSDLCRLTTETFIDRAKKLHSEKYSYENTIYSNMKIKVQIFCKKCNKNFPQLPGNHIYHGYGCPTCNRRQSKVQIQYFNFYEVTCPNIQYVSEDNEYTCEYSIPNTKFQADGFDSSTNTIIEFHGCFWHGCNKCYLSKENEMNPRSKKTFGELYKKTCTRTEILKKHGFNVKEVWECSWKRGIRSLICLQKKWKSIHK